MLATETATDTFCTFQRLSRKGFARPQSPSASNEGGSDLPRVATRTLI